MKFSRHTRRSVALLTAVLLLLCQTAFAASACAHSIAVTTSAVEMVPPCHEGAADSAMTDTAPSAPAAQSACDAPKAVSPLAPVSILAIGDMPSLLLPKSGMQGVVLASIAPTYDSSPCSSPPLSLLHCRLLN